MYKWLRCGLIASLLLLWIAPTQSWAYSYGDANTEDVAETFKLIEGALNGASPDWNTVMEAYKTRRSEIKSHFGDDIALTLDKNIEEQEAKLLVANYKAVLVLNLERRFTYASEDVKDYAGTKLLLAKAKATFDTIAPYMTSGTDEINQAFDDALDALGNPGLFGVGKKDADPELFKEKVSFIHTKVKPLFPFKAYVPQAGTVKDKPADEETTTPQQPIPDKQTAASDLQPVAEETANPNNSLSDLPDPDTSVSPEIVATETVPEAPSDMVEPPTEEEPTALAPTEPESSEATDLSENTEKVAGEEHAPMERSDKTNTGITIYVIGGLILVGGGALWFIRKKGLI